MSRGERWRWIAAGVVVFATSGRGVTAQTIPITPPPPPQLSQEGAVVGAPAQAPGPRSSALLLRTAARAAIAGA